MGKIKDFLSLLFDGEFCLGIPFLLIISALSIGFQSLLVWFCGLFPSVEHLGMSVEHLGIAMDYLFGVILLLLMYLKIDLIRFTIDQRAKENLMCGFMAEQAVIYIYVVFWGHFLVLVIGLLLLSSLLDLHEYEYHRQCVEVYETECICLLYSIGAYVALLLNGIEPAANIYGIIVLSLVTLIMWFAPKLLNRYRYGRKSK